MQLKVGLLYSTVKVIYCYLDRTQYSSVGAERDLGRNESMLQCQLNVGRTDV